MTNTQEKPRAIDHLVLPTADLDVARARLSALGFTVAPVGVHPFGTENACVYFADGTFLEPLAVRDNVAAREAARNGNVFVARDAAFRVRRGEEGVSALVFATEDAERDNAEFEDQGVSAGGMLTFSRDFVDATGKADTASFKLAFAADRHAPDVFFFTCQRVNAPKVDRAALQAHANGVARITSVVLSTKEPSVSARIVSIAADAPMSEPAIAPISIEARNATIEIVDSPALQQSFGLDEIDGDGLLIRAIVFGVEDLAETGRILTKNAVEFSRRQNRLVAPPTAGQGAAVAFEEIS
jgi:hypothetical protein